MEQKRIDGFKMIGIALRTTNENGASMKEIPQLWEKFFKENALSAIPDQVEPNWVYAVYTDYESEQSSSSPRGFYSLIIGAKVRSLAKAPEGLYAIEIPAQNYAVIPVKGPVETAMLEAWRKVWSPSFPFKRKYSYDLEIYPFPAQDDQDKSATLCISVG